MTQPEIAATLGISLGTVKSTVSRAVARLRIDAELGKNAGTLLAIHANAANRSYAAAPGATVRPFGVYCPVPDSWHYRVCRSGTRQEVARCRAR